MIEWGSAQSGYTIGFVGDRAVCQILPQPIHAPVIWKICDPRGNLIGSAASFVDAKLWCDCYPVTSREQLPEQAQSLDVMSVLHDLDCQQKACVHAMRRRFIDWPIQRLEWPTEKNAGKPRGFNLSPGGSGRYWLLGLGVGDVVAAGGGVTLKVSIRIFQVSPSRTLIAPQ
jgi:hypothetical protein